MLIDGVEALKLGLTDLRSRLAIVPQDPTLFRGTVRSNMVGTEKRGLSHVWIDYV